MAAAPSLSLTCPRCHGTFAAPVPPSGTTGWVTCPHCATPLPVVAPRDPPPLFSWEVYPQLYPRLPPARSPARRVPAACFVALVVLTVLLALLAGLLAYGGAVSLNPPTYSVAGVVQLSDLTPLPGSLVNLTGENRFHAVEVTSANGAFAFSGVPGGGITLNVTNRTYGYLRLEFFLTPLYQSLGGNPQQIFFRFSPDPTANNVTIVDTPFGDLETFLASLFGGAVVVGVAGAVAALGALGIRQHRSRTIPLAGGAAGVAAPAAVAALGLTPVFPAVSVLDALVIGIGAIVVVLYATWMARVGRAPDR